MTTRPDPESNPALVERVAEHWVEEMNSRRFIFLGLGLVTSGAGIFASVTTFTQISLWMFAVGLTCLTISIVYSIRHRIRQKAVKDYNRRKELIEERPDLVEDVPDVN